MSRPVRPGAAGAGGNEAAWIVPGIGAVVLLSSAATWLGGTLAAAWTGTGGPRAGFSPVLFGRVVGAGTASRWPGVSPTLIWVLTGVVALLLTVPLTAVAVVVCSRRLRADDPRRSLARPRDVAHLTMPRVAAGATRLRPSLAGRNPAELVAGDVGLALGRLGAPGPRTGKGKVLFSSWEDVVLAYMAPRSGKSTALAVPAVLSAPGAVIATSNKADVWRRPRRSATRRPANGSGRSIRSASPGPRRPGGGTRWPTSTRSRRPSAWPATSC